jgi:hypothetical protein
MYVLLNIAWALHKIAMLSMAISGTYKAYFSALNFREYHKIWPNIWY